MEHVNDDDQMCGWAAAVGVSSPQCDAFFFFFYYLMLDFI